MEKKLEDEECLLKKQTDPLLRVLNSIIILCVKLLAILTVLVIIWQIIAVFDLLYERIISTPVSKYNVDDILSTLGGFLAVMIAIEIFMNIVFYLKEDSIHVPLVLGTALTAIARKVIILDYTTTSPQLIYATGVIIAALGVSYWLVTKQLQESGRTHV